MSAVEQGARLQKSWTLEAAIPNLSEWLMAASGLSKGRIKHAMSCGAVLVKKPGTKWQRVRRATTKLPAASQIQLNYDPLLLAIKPPPLQLIEDAGRYSVWFKPPGVLSQGSEWGDHCSVMRLVEQHFANKRTVFLVHRLDRDASGLMMVAHDQKAAALMSELFTSRDILKQYRVRVEGQWPQDIECIDAPIDGKSAVSRVSILESGETSTLLSVVIETGRKHQIRRHLSEMGHAVLGDVLYGGRHESGLHLAATKLQFQCPVRGRFVDYELNIDSLSSYWR